MPTDLTSFDPMLKAHYANGYKDATEQDNVLLNLLMKRQRKYNAGGKSWEQPIRHAQPGGGSSDFATALAAANNQTRQKKFVVPRVKHYRLAKLDNETIESTATGDEDAFDQAFDDIDASMKAELKYLNFRLYRDSGGSIGRLTNTAFATTAATIDDPAAVWGLTIGDIVRLGPNRDGTALRVGTLTVAAISRSGTAQATVTFTANISTGVAAVVNNDFIFLQGDAGLAMSGLASWCPDLAPTSLPFFGVDRTEEPEYLGGVRVDGTDGRSMANILTDMMAQGANLGCTYDTMVMHPFAFANGVKQLDGKWVITQAAGYGGSKIANIGMKAFEVELGESTVKIYQDRCCPTKRVYGTKIDTWSVFSAGKLPGFLQKRAGSIIKVSENFDGYEARIGGYFNASCSLPGNTVVGLLA